MNDNRRIITYRFKTYEAADRAINALEAAGFSSNEIGLIANGTMIMRGEDDDRPDPAVIDGTSTGIVTGAGLGGLVGLFANASQLMIPGIGLVLVGGGLPVLLGSMAAGAFSGGLIGTLVGMGVSDDDSQLTVTALEEGSIVVIVQASGERALTALNLLRRLEDEARQLAENELWESPAIGVFTESAQLEAAISNLETSGIPRDDFTTLQGTEASTSLMRRMSQMAVGSMPGTGGAAVVSPPVASITTQILTNAGLSSEEIVFYEKLLRDQNRVLLVDTDTALVPVAANSLREAGATNMRSTTTIS